MPKRKRQNFVPMCSMTLPTPLCPALPPSNLQLRAAGRQIELVVGDEHVLGRDLVAVDGRADGLAAQIHVRRRLQQADALPGYGDLGGFALQLALGENAPPCSRASKSTNQNPAL